jgi:hypothetical protein
MGMKPPPYARRRKRFGWDEHAISIVGAIYPNALDISAGWTGVIGNVTDPANSGLLPWDTTPETATLIAGTNGAIQPIQFGFPPLQPAGDGKTYRVAMGFATVIGGVLADTPGPGHLYLEFYSGAGNRIHYSREIAVPGDGIAGHEYDVLMDDIFNPPMDLSDVGIRVTPTGEMAGKGYGLAVTYIHLRGVTAA